MSIHIPILRDAIIQALTAPFLKLPKDSSSHWLVDCTLGGGGHTEAFLQEFSKHPELKKHRILALDQDFDAVTCARARFKAELNSGLLRIEHCRFGDCAPLLRRLPENQRVLGMMADLGFSSDQMQDSSRGLSFQEDGPLDMRLDPTRGQTCLELLEQISQVELEKILSELGEERFFRQIASTIISRRRSGRVPKTTKELVDAIVHSVPGYARHGRIHIATRTFQALRIAVNEELSQLDSLLQDVILEIEPGGRVAILSFHSLEDRRVKQRFKDADDFKSLTKKPVQADEEEERINPRSRSAKLRIAERTS